MNKRAKLFFYFSLALIFALFCYFRLKPIYFQTVPYTYDQGRDFLQAEAIVRDHRFTLLGPTTGIQGLFHGVWWYYFLSIPYLLFGGNPNGFIIFIFLTALVQVVLFSLFLKKKFGLLPAFAFLLLISLSPYFISTSFFASNAILNLPALLLLFYSTYAFFKKKSLKFLFLIFLSIGFSFEAGVSFGVFLIPSTILTIILSNNLKTFFGTWKKFAAALAGLLIPLLPRIIFEIRHDFLQTKTVLGFITKPTFHNPHSLKGIIIERFNIFSNYFFSLFPTRNGIVVFIMLLFIIGGFFLGYKKLKKDYKNFFLFFLILFFAIFTLSLFYKDTFWANYAEGISYFYCLFIVDSIFMLSKEKSVTIKRIPYLILGILLIFGVINFYKDLKSGAPKKIYGMKEQIIAVDTIYNSVDAKNDFCVRVYTPPVIPYTYNYLFDYASHSRGLKKPSPWYTDNKCWYIVEREPYGFRLKKWKAENIPSGAKMLKKEIISDNVHIELWQEKK